MGDSPDGPVVKDPPADTGDTGSIPRQGIKVPHVVNHSCSALAPWSPWEANETSPVSQQRFQKPQLRPEAAKHQINKHCRKITQTTMNSITGNAFKPYRDKAAEPTFQKVDGNCWQGEITGDFPPFLYFPAFL